MRRCAIVLFLALAVVGCGPRVAALYQTPPARMGSEIFFLTSVASNADPYEAGREAAEDLKRRVLKPPLAVLVSECFDGEARKAKALRGVCSVFPRQIVFGGATYGSFTHAGVADRDAVTLLAITGQGISVAAALQQNLGTAKLSAEKDQAEIEERLRNAGAGLVAKLPRAFERGLLIIIADAHSPKNGPLVEGIKQALVKPFPITGGSVNKNAGQTFVYYQGRMFQDSALALLLTGDFLVSMVGRQAKEGAEVVATAEAAARKAVEVQKGKPFAVLAFDCAGRKGKLVKVEEELAAIKRGIEETLPLFGCYCAGEIGPADGPDAKPNGPSSGVGWHIMVTVLGR
ncbi:MAG TPA: FIST N-terminal domain-containing protein [Planctomycetota bacterium]|nr:FIST N-terminal domain-containing protein [Planctomycetota bacterium]